MQEDQNPNFSDNELNPEDIEAMGADATQFEEPTPEPSGFGETLSPEDLSSPMDDQAQDIPDYLRDDSQL